MMRAGSTVLHTAMSSTASAERPARCAEATTRSRTRSIFSLMLTKGKDKPQRTLRSPEGVVKTDSRGILGLGSGNLPAALQWFAGKVIQRICQQQESEDRKAIRHPRILGDGMRQGIFRQPIARFDQLERDAQQSNDAAGGDQSAGEQRSGADFGLQNIDDGFFLVRDLALAHVFHQLAHHASAEHDERGANGNVEPDGKRERADSQQLYSDNHNPTDKAQTPG